MVVPIVFGPKDFIAVSALLLSLYRSFKNAPAEFQEISRELESFHIVVADLISQAEDEHSLLNRKGAERKAELMTLRDNLMGTMQELVDLHARYEKMGRMSWSRFSLGQKDLGALRSKLTVEIAAVNAFMSSLMFGALGRMEPMLQRVYELLSEQAKNNVNAAHTIVSATLDAKSDLAPLEFLLRTEGIPLDYIEQWRGEIQEVAKTVIDENNLHESGSSTESIHEDYDFMPEEIVLEDFIPDDDGIYAEDSISVVGSKSIHKPHHKPRVRKDKEVLQPERPKPVESSLGSPFQTNHPRRKMSVSQWLQSFTSQERLAQMQLKNQGFDIATQSSTMGRLISRAKMPFEADILECAINTHNRDAIKLLLERGCNPNALPTSRVRLIVRASWIRDWGLVEMLFLAGAKMENTICHSAARDGQNEMIRTLAKRHSIVGLVDMRNIIEKWHAPYLPFWQCHPDKEISAMPKDAQISLLYKNDEWAPIHVAAKSGHAETVKVLLESGANASQCTSKAKYTAMHLVCRYKESQEGATIIQLLLKYNAALEARNILNETPLWTAVLSHRFNLAKVLLSNGANIYPKITLNHAADSLLHIAAGHNYWKIVRLLHEFGADMEMKLDLPTYLASKLIAASMTKYGRRAISAIQIACLFKSWQAASYLKDCGVSLEGLDEIDFANIQRVPPKTVRRRRGAT